MSASSFSATAVRDSKSFNIEATANLEQDCLFTKAEFVIFDLAGKFRVFGSELIDN